MSTSKPKTLNTYNGWVGDYRLTRLSNGLRVISEAVDSTYAASIGIWVKVGSRDEEPHIAGASHFLEHLLFKGTERRTALEISAEIEQLGGDFNAFTTKELTCYHIDLLGEHAGVALDVLLDMMFNSVISEADYELERSVVLEEIAMGEDDPSDVLSELFSAVFYAGNSLADPIAGTVSSITQMQRADVIDHYRRWYSPENMVIAAGGRVNHNSIVELVQDWVTQNFKRDGLPATSTIALPTGSYDIKNLPEPVYSRPNLKVTAKHKPIEQNHIAIAFPGLADNDDRHYPLSVLNTAFGEGMSSRLFQEVREKRGLAYSVSSGFSSYQDQGSWGVWVSCTLEKTAEAISVIMVELEKIAQQGLTEPEVKRSRDQCCHEVILGQESAASRMSRLGNAELMDREVRFVDDILAKYRNVTQADVARIAQDIISRPITLCIVGKTEDIDWESIDWRTW